MSLGHFPNHTSISFQSIWYDERDQWIRNERGVCPTQFTFMHYWDALLIRAFEWMSVGVCQCACVLINIRQFSWIHLSHWNGAAPKWRKGDSVIERERGVWEWNQMMQLSVKTVQTHCEAWINNNFAMCTFAVHLLQNWWVKGEDLALHVGRN